MPKYLFFLVLGLTAVLILLLLKRLRGAVGRADRAAAHDRLDPRRTLAAGAALILLTNAVALSGVFINRSGEPESRLMLSERELSLPYRRLPPGGEQRPGADADLARARCGRGFRLRTTATNYGGQPAWLDAAHLATLGFDTIAPANATQEARERLARQLPRQVLLVLETRRTGVAAGRRPRTGKRCPPEHAAAAAANPGSEAFAKQAEAGRNARARGKPRQPPVRHRRRPRRAAAAFSRYPDRGRYLILRGTVRPTLRRHDRQSSTRRLYQRGRHHHINVPFALRPVLEPLRNAPQPLPDASTPRYEVQLTVGQRLEPWIETLTTPAAKP
jgi:hypothetical protein